MKNHSPDQSSKSPTLIRLNKYIAESGVCSRRMADELITTGQVKINDRVITELGTKIDPDQDTVMVRKRPISPQKKLIYVFNKPRGVVSTNKDPEGRRTVVDFFPKEVRLYPVGRLDADSEGLLILTNDGDLAQRLTHPKFQREKVYEVWLESPKLYDLKEITQKLTKTYHILGKRARLNHVSFIGREKDGLKFQVILKQGLNRQIRRIAGRAGFAVTRLKRIQQGKLKLGQLDLGEARLISELEI